MNPGYRKSLPLIALLCATATAGYICRVNVSTAAPLLMEDFGLSQIEMGRIFSAFLLGYAFAQVPAGMLADRFGAARVLSAALWIWVALTVLQTLSGVGPLGSTATGALFIFIIFRIALGVSASPAYPAAGKGVKSWISPAFHGRANGIIIASIGIGSAIAPPLVSNIMVHWGWRAALIFSALPALFTAVIWLYFKAPAPTMNIEAVQSDPVNPASAGKLKSRGFYLLTLSYSLQGYVGYIFVAWFYLYLVQERHFTLLTGAWWSSLPWVLSIFSIPAGGWLSDKLVKIAGEQKGRKVVPVAGMILSALFTAAGAHTSDPIVAALCLAFATAFILCVEGPFWSMMMSIAGSKSGMAGGIMNMGSNIGGLISPALTPVIASRIGWENALLISAALSVAGGLLWFGIRD